MSVIDKKFVFTVGPPGSGKSTTFPMAYEADKYPNLYSETGQIKKGLLQLAHKQCLDDCISDMIGGKEFVIQSNTNLEPRNLLSYLEACVKYDYQVICILPINDLLYFQDENLKSRYNQIQHLLKTRSSGIRIIPEDIIYRMVNDFDTVKLFYKNLLDEKRPEKWIEAIKNPFLEYNTYPISTVDITKETLYKIKTNSDITLYTPVMDCLEIIIKKDDMLIDEMTIFQTNNLIQLKNRRLAFLTLISHQNLGFVILWNDGYDLDEINHFIKNSGILF